MSDLALGVLILLKCLFDFKFPFTFKLKFIFCSYEQVILGAHVKLYLCECVWINAFQCQCIQREIWTDKFSQK